MNQNLKKLKKNSVYGKVIAGMRLAGVNRKNPGAEMIALAAVKKLINPNITLDEILKFLVKNQEFDGVFKKINEQDAFLLMKEALSTLNTKHSIKVEDDNVVEKFINNLTTEIRLRTMLLAHTEEKEISIDNTEADIFIDTLMRMYNKPEEDLKQVLYRMAGKYNIEDIKDVESILVKILQLDKEDEIYERLKYILKHTDVIIF